MIGEVLIGAASLVVVLVMAWLVRKVTAGDITPLPVHQLVTAQQEHIALLVEQNTALRREREFDRSEHLELIRRATEGLLSVHLFMARYEQLGGMAMADRESTD